MAIGRYFTCSIIAKMTSIEVEAFKMLQFVGSNENNGLLRAIETMSLEAESL